MVEKRKKNRKIQRRKRKHNTHTWTTASDAKAVVNKGKQRNYNDYTVRSNSRLQFSLSSFCIHSSADRSTYENKPRRPQLLCSRSLCVEQSAERLAIIGHVVKTFRSRLKALLFGHWSLGSPFAALREFWLYK